VDPSQLENALLNLCINSRDAMPDGGSIEIQTSNLSFDAEAALMHDLPPGDYLVVTVNDSGTGIPQHILGKVFDPFFTTKPIGEGTGLGLSMVYGFAQQSGGKVELVSVCGSGTSVSIYLPRHTGVADAVETQENFALTAPSDKRRTVLVVEDEPMIRALIVETLADLRYKALEAEDSATGLKILQSEQVVDLLISDLGLPGGLSGRQLADAALQVRPDLQVLFITGYAESAVMNNAQLPPSMRIMTKPFDMQVLASQIKAMAESSGQTV
jgi:CheY-like chemotaxis protein